MNRLSNFYSIIILIFCLVLSGCSGFGNNPDELNKLTKEDPRFKRVVDTQQKIQSEVRYIKNDLLNKKKNVDAAVEKLRGEYDAYSKAQNLKIEKYQSVMNQHKSAMRADIDILSERLDSKVQELGRHEKTLEDVQKVLEQSQAMNLTPTEKQKWQERITIQNERIVPLRQEIENLKAQIKVEKKKLSFIN